MDDFSKVIYISYSYLQEATRRKCINIQNYQNTYTKQSSHHIEKNFKKTKYDLKF